jgi:recombination protein RecT
MADRPKAAPPRGGALAERSLIDLFKTDQVGRRFERYAPSPEIGRAVHTSALLTLQRDWEVFQHANRLQVMQAMFGYARLGLEINTPRQYAYLIAFRTKDGVTIEQIIGYRGYLHLSRESGQLIDITGKVVTQQEIDLGLFDYQFGTDSFLRHKLGSDRSSRRVYAYGVALLKGGVQKFDILPWEEIDRIRDGSSGFQHARSKGLGSIAYQKNPWVAHTDEMAVKTVFRRMSKTLDISGRFDMAVALEEASERGETNYGAILDLDPNEWRIGGLEEEVEQEGERRKQAEQRQQTAAAPQQGAPAQPKAAPRQKAPQAEAAPQESAGSKPAEAPAEPPREEPKREEPVRKAAPPRQAAPADDEPPPPQSADDYWGR